jgi:hypothetical protein
MIIYTYQLRVVLAVSTCFSQHESEEDRLQSESPAGVGQAIFILTSKLMRSRFK